METVRIHDKEYDIVLYLDNNKFFGYKFNKDNTIKKVDKNVFKYFDFFTCSNDIAVLPSVNDYQIVIDNKTNFKHYFKNGQEDYELFFKNNGKEMFNFIQNQSIKDLIKMGAVSFAVGAVTVCLTLEAHDLIVKNTNNITNITQEVVNEQKVTDEENEEKVISYVVSNDITYQDIISLISNSNNLTEEEKKFLINSDLINDILPTINEKSLDKYVLVSSIRNLDIQSFVEGEEGVEGYYNSSSPNIIYVKNYDGFNSDIKETIAHEFIHVLQDHYCNYTLLKEATAEIISSEYFDDIGINAYHDQVYSTKKLMEIIGPDPVWKYVFTGDFSLIEENVKPYLNEEQYESFLNCLTYDYYDEKDNFDKIDQLDELLNILYENKFAKDVNDDIIISLLDNRDDTLRRYYFNKKYINKENSYYEDGSEVTSVSMTINEAVLKEYVVVEEEIKEYITSDKVYEFLQSHDNKGLKRHCKYSKDFKETSASFKNDGIKISGYLNGELISDASEEELIEKGVIIECEYFYIKERKILTPQEFFEEKYDKNNKLNYISNPDKCYFVAYNPEGDMEVYFSSISELPTIYDRFENNKVR